MSNKPPKKSDENKRWRKPRRDRGSRISPEYHLIITEGSKTEPLYFEGLKKAVNQNYTGRIEIVGLGERANEAFKLAKEAIKLDENCADAYQCAANVCMSLSRYEDPK